MLLTSYLIGLLMLLVVKATDPYGNEETKQADDQRPRLLSRHKRFLVTSQYLWPKAVVPYAYEDSILSQKHEIERVMEFIEDQSCIRFPSSATMNRQLYGLDHQARITFWKGEGCFSAVGFSKVGVRTSCCTGEACLHEIGHALGFSHEQNNPKRDGWIEVNMGVVPAGNKGQYALTTSNQYNYSRPYDISTMMHYFPVEFTKGKPAYAKSFPELSIAQQYFYFFKEITEGYKCYEKPQCQGRLLKCANDGFQTILHGKCRCNCPTGLDPDNLCKTPLKKVISSWPKGQYALPKPKSGCPNDGSFQDAHVIHKGPDGNAMSSPYHMAGEVKDTHVELHFCTRTMKDDIFNSDEGSKFNWPLGNYCIYKKGDKCPTGFDVRSIEYHISRQSMHGPISAVTARGMTLCCQYRGFPKEPASFPNNKQFALIQYPKEKCQKVTGMRSTQESFTISNSQAFKVDPIFSTWLSNVNKFITIPLCYYRPVDMDCGRSITLSKSHPEVTISMSGRGRTDLECTWVVKGDTEKGTLVLDFEEFNVKKEGNNCADKVEVRHARIGQFGLEYCGEVKHSIRSITDKLLVRFFTTGNSDSSFKAKIKWITLDDMCYDIENKGVSYDGRVNYTRIFQPCLPWAEMTECPHHPFLDDRSEQLDNLEGNACRNPDNSFRPWCYTDKAGCQRNYCDVCGIEKPYDHLDYCKQLKDHGFCIRDAAQAIKYCAATCCDLLPNKPLEIKSCPPDYTLFKDTCFGLAAEVKSGTYDEAVEACRKEGGTVAAPKSQEEAAIIAKLVKYMYTWIGITDKQTEGRWVYEDGTDVVWTNWNAAEPNNINNEDAAVMTSNTKWIDVPFGYKYYFACSVPKLKNGRMTCGQPSPPGDGVIIGTVKHRYELGETVQYKCKNTHSVVTSRCMTSGQWSKQDSACRACPPEYTLLKNTCYGRSKDATTATYNDAVHACKNEGGVVAAPKSQEEANLISKIVNNQFTWIGINDKQSEGRWVYDDDGSTQVVWTNWDAAEPNNIGNEDAAVMKSSTKWMDIAWYYQYHFACSFPKWEPSACLDVLGREKCESLLTDRPSLCGDYPGFALDYCRRSCGICNIVDVKCSVKPTNHNVLTLSTSESTIPVGEFVKYSCERFKYHINGDNERACLSNGKLSGEPLQCGDCPLGFKMVGKECHGLLEGKLLTFKEAQAECKKLDGFVAMPKTQQDNDAISIVGVGAKIWIGITVRANENSFMWEDGSDVTWNQWAPGEPKTSGEMNDCVFINENKHWVNANCEVLKLMTVCTISKLDDDLCYDMKDGGVSYDGSVNYTRTFKPCLPWTRVTNCPHHSFNIGYEVYTLEGNACRNPDNSYRPWCYTDNNGCKRNYCDVCGNETPQDNQDNCDRLKGQGLCTRDAVAALKNCAATCFDSLPNKTPVKKYTDIECGPPNPPSDGIVVGYVRSKYKVGDTVEFKCKWASWGVFAACLTSGQWSKVRYACSECPNGFSKFGDTCYSVMDGVYPYKAAVELCKEKGSSVAVPKNQEEATHIIDISNTHAMWVGLSDETTEGSWISEDGTLPVWTNWYSSEPNGNRGENCIQMMGNTRWIDVPCAYGLQAICAVSKYEISQCQDFLVDQCPQLLREKPTMCQEFPAFSRSHCAKTCGTCNSEGNARCLVENTDPFVSMILTTADTKLTTGQYVKYACTKNTYRIKGDEVRACLLDGKLTGEPLQCGDCPMGFKMVSNACYGLVEGKLLTFEEAKKECEAVGGFVAMPKSIAENKFISSLGEGQFVWIGVTKDDSKDTYIWEDGSKLNWRNWADGYPKSDCVAMNTNGQWINMDCKEQGSKTVCTIPQRDTRCNNGLFKDTCYSLIKDGKTLNYENGVSACKEIGGKVAVPRNQEEARFVQKIANYKSIWLGVNDKETEGTWANQDGNELTWTKWNAAEPNNYGNGEDCAAMVQSTGWMDVPCDYGYPVVCGVQKVDSEVHCEAPLPPTDEEIVETHKPKYKLGETVEFKCKWGPWSVLSRCMTNGQWSETGHACLECPGINSNGTCYTLIEKTLTYDNSVAFCKTRGANVAAPKSQEEAYLVSKMVGQHQLSWVGITDKETEGSWVYEDGTSLVWTNWNQGEPNDYGKSGEDCAAMYPGTKWVDIPCDYHYRGVCSKKLEVL